jgi:hypothetical protein
MALCFFLVLVDAASFLLAGLLLAEVGVAFFVAAFFGVALFDAVLLAAGGASPVSTEDWDWATAGDEEPSEDRKKIAAKTTTAKLRTQTLPTAESWRP